MCVIGRQYFIEGSKNNPENYLDLRVPFFTVVEVTMYLACLKVLVLKFCIFLHKI